MNNKRKLILFTGLLVLVANLVFLSGCSALTGEDATRITKLEDDVQANTIAIAKLQEQVQALKPAVPISPAPTAPPVITPTTAPTTPAPTTPVPPQPAPPANGLLPTSSIVLSNLTLTPAQVNLGDTVTMSVNIKNTGTVDGVYKVVLQETNKQLSTDVTEYANSANNGLIALKAGETKTITFTTSHNVAGTYTIKAGPLTGTYLVIDPSLNTSN